MAYLSQSKYLNFTGNTFLPQEALIKMQQETYSRAEKSVHLSSSRGPIYGTVIGLFYKLHESIQTSPIIFHLFKALINFPIKMC